MHPVWRPFVGGVQDFSTGIWALRAPLILSILAFFILSAPDQIKELYLIFASDWQRDWLQVLLAFGSLAGLSYFIANVARALGVEDEATYAAPVRTRVTLRLMPSILGLLPVLGAAWGLYTALTSATTDALRQSKHTFDLLQSQGAAVEAMRQLEPYGAALKTPKPNSEAALAGLVDWVAGAVPETILTVAQRTDRLAPAIFVGIGFCVLWAFVLLAVFRPMRFPAESGDITQKARVFAPASRYAFTLMGLTLTALFAAQHLNAGKVVAVDFTSIPRALGTIFLLNLFLAFLVFFSTLLVRASDRHDIPLLSLLITVALAASYWDLNDNHAVRLLETPRPDAMKRATTHIEHVMQLPHQGSVNKDEKKLVSIHDAFDAWYASRPAEYRNRFANRPYPIYIVAAQGGGMYAANLSGLFLARLYDRCPAIRHHLFAVSGVSGGSVGAGLFAALLNDSRRVPPSDSCDAIRSPIEGGPLEKKIKPLLRTDFLSPLAASFFFPDFLQRFIPSPIVELDRARAFEAGLEEAWESVIQSSPNPLRAPFWQHWRADGDAPMLLLNTTIVERGQQVAVAPAELQPRYHIDAESQQSLHTALEIPVGLDVPLSTAMSLSARFPGLMPAGLVRVDGSSARLVDGGYFDNSGVETALAIIDRIKNCHLVPAAECKPREPNYSFRLIVVTDYDAAAHFYRDPLRDHAQGFNEILSPVRAFYNARIERGQITVDRANRDFADAERPLWVQLRHDIYKLALGWRLSSEAQDVISGQIGDPARCKSDKAAVSNFINYLSWIEEAVAIRDQRTAQSLNAPTAYSLITALDGRHCALKTNVIDVINRTQQ